MLVRRYEMPWRRAFEAYAGLAWLIAAMYFTAVAVLLLEPSALAAPIALGCLLAGALRLLQAVRVLRLRDSLGGRGIEMIGTRELARLCRANARVNAKNSVKSSWNYWTAKSQT